MLNLNELVEYSSDGIMYVDSEGKIFYWNRGATKLLGWTPKEVIGKSIDILLVKGAGLLNELLNQSKKDGKFWIEGMCFSMMAKAKDLHTFDSFLKILSWTVGDKNFFAIVVRPKDS